MLSYWNTKRSAYGLPALSNDTRQVPSPVTCNKRARQDEDDVDRQEMNTNNNSLMLKFWNLKRKQYGLVPLERVPLRENKGYSFPTDIGGKSGSGVGAEVVEVLSKCVVVNEEASSPKPSQLSTLATLPSLPDQASNEAVSMPTSSGGDVDSDAVSSSPTSGSLDKSFILAEKWRGAIRGYSFKKGDKGMGYYLDSELNESSETKEGSASQPVIAPTPLASSVSTSGQSVINPSEALAKIGKALTGNKIMKAIPLFEKLAAAQLSYDTAPLFIATLKNSFITCAKKENSAMKLADVLKLDSPTRGALASLFIAWNKQVEGINTKAKEAASVMNGGGGGSGKQIDDSEINAVKAGIGVRCGLFSDDSFTFATSMKTLRLLLNQLPLQPNENQVLFRQAVLDCFETAWAQKTRPWAKSEIESTFNMGAERRDRFLEEERERLDQLTQKMTEAQRKVIMNRAVRAVNSEYHPLRSKGGRDAFR